MSAGSRWLPAYVGLGSNLADPEQQVRGALEELGSLPETRLVTHSRLYRSPPMGPVAQTDFINAVAALVTRLPPRVLLAALQGIEDAHGRDRTEIRWGPRTLDLDLLLVADLRLDESPVRLPHPGVHERNFVLYPLAEIAPALMVPGQGRVAQLAARCPRGELALLE